MQHLCYRGKQYLLVKEKKLVRAEEKLKELGCIFEER
jgi:hypothetical protein